MRPASRPALSSRIITVTALILLAALTSCGGDSDRGDTNLSTLDARLTNGAVVGSAEPDAMSDAAGPTLGSIARSQRTGDDGSIAASRTRLSGDCASNVRYGNQWARAMPAAFAVYPGGHLVEAAGIENARCTLRVVSFTTAARPDEVISHYQARARDAGYDAERQICQNEHGDEHGDEHRLGGVRAADGAAYMLYARRTASGVTEVDIVTGEGA